MGPELKSSGKRNKVRLYNTIRGASMGPELKSSGKRFLSFMSGRGGAIASMGPELKSSGKRPTLRAIKSRQPSFNGAGAQKLRKTAR